MLMINNNLVKSPCHFTVVLSFYRNKITLLLHKSDFTFSHSQPAAEAKRLPEKRRSLSFLSQIKAATLSSVPARLK